MEVTIYHNAACGTSRDTLALIRNAGVEPTPQGAFTKEDGQLLIDAEGRRVG